MRGGTVVRAVSCAVVGATILTLVPARSQPAAAPAGLEHCAANLKALYQACLAYAADHGDRFPSAQTKRPAPEVWRWWYDDLKPYLTDPRVVCCQASRQAAEYGVWDEPEPLLPAPAFSPHWVSYGMTWWFSKDNDPRAPYRLADLAKPADTPLFADSKSYLISSHRSGWDVDARHDGALLTVLCNGQVVRARPDYQADGSYHLKRVPSGETLTWGPR